MFKKVQVPFLKGTVTQTSATQRDSGAWHGGNDYSAPIGTPILLGTSGTVIWSGYNLPGDLGAATGYLQLVQGLQSGGGKFTENASFFAAANDEFLKRVA